MGRMSEERWKVRARMLEERVNAVSKKLASQMEDAAHLRVQHQHDTAKVGCPLPNSDESLL